jgi:starvation-inducible outer membrane lipoprotein
MPREAFSLLCAVMLAGCSSTPNFVKLDSNGRPDLSANPETFQRDLAECKLVEDHVKMEGSLLFNSATPRAALDNCMRSKGYAKS